MWICVDFRWAVAALSSFLAIAGLVDVSQAFVPTGEFDLGPADLNALCPMIKEFGETGNIPKPQTIKEAPADSGPDCVYFKWNACKGAKVDAAKPCGWYQMTKCSGKAKRELRGAEQRRRFVRAGDFRANATDDGDAAFIQFPNFEGKI